MFNYVLNLAVRYRQINWALADQAMVSAANFLTAILLVRYIGDESTRLAEYGRFVLAFMAIEFVRIFHEPLVIAPMVIIGPKQRAADADSYYGAVCASEFVISLLAGLLLFFAVLVLNVAVPDWNLEGMALLMGFGALTCHLQTFLRRYAFARHTPKIAFASDAVRYLGQLAILFALLQTHKLYANDVLLIVAVTAFFAIFCGIPIVFPIRFDRDTFLSAVSRHWDFGKWLLPSAALGRALGDLFTATAGAMVGAAAVGALRAARVIVGVTHIFLMGFENVIPIQAAQRFSAAGKAGLTRYLWRYGVVSCVGVGLILLVLAAVPDFWLTLFYGDEFDGQGHLVQWWAAIYFLLFLGKAPMHGLRAMEHTQPIFWQNVVLAVVSIALCYPLIETLGIIGVVAGTALLEIIRNLMLTYSFRKRLRAEPRE
jgi:O-antigen/teichoic acid export membrane protein